MKVVDLTLEIYDGLQTYDSHPAIEIKEQSTFENSKHRYLAPCEGFESRMLSFSDHSGTHIDAPLHFIRGGEAANEMDVNKVFGPALLLDVSDFKQPNEPVTKEMLQEAGKRQGMVVRENDIVLVRTRKGQWGDEGFFDEKAFEKSAGEWLLEKKVNVVGLDLPNIDVNDNMKREVHMDVLGNDIYIVENLVHLDRLPKDARFLFFAFPLKLRNATASPVRAIALLDAQFN